MTAIDHREDAVSHPPVRDGRCVEMAREHIRACAAGPGPRAAPGGHLPLAPGRGDELEWIDEVQG